LPAGNLKLAGTWIAAKSLRASRMLAAWRKGNDNTDYNEQ
jgi:hypothetical protein